MKRRGVAGAEELFQKKKTVRPVRVGVMYELKKSSLSSHYKKHAEVNIVILSLSLSLD